MMDDRAVTQTLGFALTFAVIITSVTIVAAVGTDQLETFRDSQELQNAVESALEPLSRRGGIAGRQCATPPGLVVGSESADSVPTGRRGVSRGK